MKRIWDKDEINMKKCKLKKIALICYVVHGGFSYVSVERRAESGHWRAEILGNFGRSSAYFHGIRYILNSIFGRHPIPVDTINKNCSRNQRIL